MDYVLQTKIHDCLVDLFNPVRREKPL